ncbi:hypothetical protein CV023_04725 [Brevibacterium sp. CCUG 69071]|nr:hypothetical protein [Brevibacterium sp. CCUG 69071]
MHPSFLGASSAEGTFPVTFRQDWLSALFDTSILAELFKSFMCGPSRTETSVMRITMTMDDLILPMSSIQCTMLGTHHVRGIRHSFRRPPDRER